MTEVVLKPKSLDGVMEVYDVLIVGGGPAGSSCAWRLSDAGMSVLVLDKSAFPRNKPCAGWITPQIVAALQLDVDHYRRDRVWQPIEGFRSGLIGGDAIEVAYPHPVSYGIRRCEFDAYLLDRAGPRCQIHESVGAIERRNDQWVINNRYGAPMLVGAGGHFCPIARLLGPKRKPAASIVAAQQVEFEATPQQLRASSIRPETPELFFCPDLQGYGWCFRKGNYINIGLGRLDSSQLSNHVEAFCRFLRERNSVAGEIPSRFSGHAYQLYERVQPRLFDEGVVLVGDSAGLAYPQSGEGIRPAVESGLIAADVILAARNYGRENLARYHERITSRLGQPRSEGLMGWLPAAWLHYLGSRLLATKWFAKHVVMDRWFLHNRQAPLLSE